MASAYKPETDTVTGTVVPWARRLNKYEVTAAPFWFEAPHETVMPVVSLVTSTWAVLEGAFDKLPIVSGCETVDLSPT